jgi:hypothetical protein
LPDKEKRDHSKGSKGKENPAEVSEAIAERRRLTLVKREKNKAAKTVSFNESKRPITIYQKMGEDGPNEVNIESKPIEENIDYSR